jgi:hypothetical protein
LDSRNHNQTRYPPPISANPAIFNSLVRTEELTNGYEFVLNEDINLLHDLADWLPLEHKCCPFLQFTLTLYKDKFIRLQLTGPEEIKGFLIQELELSQ